MAVTPQTNTDLGAIAEALRSRDDFIICGHVSPDGDCLGSQLGLAAALKGLGKRVTCLLAKDEPIDERLGFLPGAAELVPAASFDGIARPHGPVNSLLANASERRPPRCSRAAI